MLGNNPIRKAVFGDGLTLEVKSIFKTLQGEGPFVGKPSVFIRLGGCNLNCSFCDTDFEDFEQMHLDQILLKVNDFAVNEEGEKTIKLVVITGGEPFRQPIEKLCDQLIGLGYEVQIETNGTIYKKIHEDVKLVCSPKSTNKGYYAIRPDLLSRINAFKFLISKNLEAYRQVPDVGQFDSKADIYIQAMDEGDEQKNQENLKYVLQLALKKGFILSLQTHKILGVE